MSIRQHNIDSESNICLDKETPHNIHCNEPITDVKCSQELNKQDSDEGSLTPYNHRTREHTQKKAPKLIEQK